MNERAEPVTFCALTTTPTINSSEGGIRGGAHHKPARIRE
jgi:hypothetical protein